MALKSKLTALKKQVGKLVASVPRKGQGAGWLAHWRLDDVTKLVSEVVPREKYGHDVTCIHAVAMAFVVQKEAALAGMADATELAAALDALNEAIDRSLNPPRGTNWQGREVLRQAVIAAIGPVGEFLFRAVWQVPDDHSYPPGGRPPRLEQLPAEWFSAEFNTKLTAFREGDTGEPGDKPS